MNRVFVLSQEKHFFSSSRQWVSPTGRFSIHLFTDVLDLIAALLKAFCPLVILDIDMLNGKTKKLIHILRSIQKDIQIILILSQEKIGSCSDALPFGVISYQIKPVSHTKIKELIESSLTHIS